jgi:spore maturation protein CgeB
MRLQIMRILFLESHPMWVYGLPNGFKDLGHQVKTSEPLNRNNITPIISEFKPDLVFTIGWTPDNDNPINQNIIRNYVKSANIPHIYWATEDPTHTLTFSLPYIKNTQPDFIFTICPTQVDNYQKLGFKATHLDFGFHPSVHYPTGIIEQYNSSLAVVANAYPNRLAEYPDHFRHTSLQTLIKPLIEANIRIDFWGRYWERMKPILGVEISPEWIHGYLNYPEVNKVYSSAAIVIGLQNHLTQLTQRTYEILSSGGFLITSDTPEIRRLFEPARDLVVSLTPEETISSISYYLQHPKEREQIRQQAIRTVAPHSYKHRAEYILKVLQKHRIL